MDQRYGRDGRPSQANHPRRAQDDGARRTASPAQPPTRPPARTGSPGGLLSRSAAPSGNGSAAADGAASRSPRLTHTPSHSTGANGNGGNGAKHGRGPAGGLSGLPASRRGGSNGLLSRARDFGETVLRATVMRKRSPRAGDWRASDFTDGQLDAWDRRDAVPFDVPPDPDAPPRRRPDGRSSVRSQSRSSGRGHGERLGWDDDELDSSWETGTWDTEWASGRRHSMDYGRSSRDDSGFYRPGRGDSTMPTMAMLAAPRPGVTRRDRVRLLMARRPAAAALLLFMLAGFLLSAIAPMIPLLRLGFDVGDLAYRVSALQSMLSNSSALFNPAKLQEAQGDIDSIQRDLYEINGAVDMIGGPLGAVSHSVRDYRLLIHMGYDLTAAGDEAVQVAETLLTPLAGGALSSDPSTPGITAADISRARALLADAQTRVVDAVGVYNQLDVNALPAQLKPGSKYGQLLAMLPLAPNAFVELNSLLDAAPAMLGVGNPAYYLVLAMDRTELRPGGGFMGNYGILELDSGKQSKDRPLSLGNTYDLDTDYFRLNNPNFNNPSLCAASGPKPPELYWWWPYRQLICLFNWGLRDSNLSPDFPTNARTAIDIVQSAHGVPGGQPIQGVVAFTPVLIADLLAVTGPIDVPTFGAHVTADNLETMIHEYQLVPGKTPSGVDRKEFTHQLSSLLLDRLKQLPKSQLKDVLSIVEDALKHKDLQIYLSDPRAELVLQQLGLASEVNRGEGDGFFVVDTNDGGNKANLYVTEHQTDFVSLLPDGGALHRTQISVIYNKQGSIYNPGVEFDDYSDVQRTYLPSDATIFGYNGFNTRMWSPDGCDPNTVYWSLITYCDTNLAHVVRPSTASDVAGRAMVMGPLMVWCGAATSPNAYSTYSDYVACESHPTEHIQTVYIEWYTPHAFNRGADGHGVYTELVEKQAGTTVYQNGSQSSLVTLTVYVSTAALSGGQSLPGDTVDQTITGSTPQARDAAFAHLLQGNNVQKVFDGPLLTNTPVSASF